MSLPALTAAQMAEVDRLMIDEYGILLIQMMENAGRNLAELARRMLDGKLAGRKIVALCGAGNNGGGGMVAARHLHNRGADVSVKFVGDAARLKEIPAHQWRILQALGLAQNDDFDLAQADVTAQPTSMAPPPMPRMPAKRNRCLHLAARYIEALGPWARFACIWRSAPIWAE